MRQNAKHFPLLRMDLGTRPMQESENSCGVIGLSRDSGFFADRSAACRENGAESIRKELFSAVAAPYPGKLTLSKPDRML